MIDLNRIQVWSQLLCVLKYPVFQDFLAFKAAISFHVVVRELKKKDKLVVEIPFGNGHPLCHNGGSFVVLGQRNKF